MIRGRRRLDVLDALDGHDPDDSWVRSLVVAAAAILTVAVAAIDTKRIFADGGRWWVALAAAVTSGVVALAVRRLGPAVRVVAVVVATVGALVAGVLAAAGSVGDAATAVSDGISLIVSSWWPVPVEPASVGAVTAIAGLAGATAVDLAVHGRRLSALVPGLAVMGLTSLLAAEGGPPSTAVLCAFVAAALASLTTTSPAARNGVALLLAIAMAAIAVAVPVGVSSSSTDRYDPRERRTDPDPPDFGVSPLARLAEWRSIEPAAEMFTTSSPVARRWRLVGLTNYDGVSWQPATDYRPAGDLGAGVERGGATESVELRIEALDTPWIPVVDDVVDVDVDVRRDATRSALLPDDAPRAGSSYDLVVEPVDVQPAALTAARAATPVTPFVDGYTPSPELLTLASTAVAGARTDYERASALAGFLRDQYRLDPDVPPGHSSAVVELFLERSRRGTDEQFVAAYAILAASVGLPVRVAVGFRTEVDADDAGRTVAASSSATAWPEVAFEGFGWIPFDPVPTESDDDTPSLGEGAIAPVEEDLALPPQTTVPPSVEEAADEPEEAEESTPVTATSGDVPRPVVIGVGVVLAVLSVIASYGATVLLLKRRRRRRRREAGDPSECVVNAFVTSYDLAVDLGAPAPRAASDRQLVATGTEVIGAEVAEFSRLAAVATEAVYGPNVPSEATVELAWGLSELVEHRTASAVGARRFARAQLSGRSFRRGLHPRR